MTTGSHPVLLPSWTDALSVGVPLLDEQHKSLFAVVADLRHILDGDGGFDAVMSVLWKLSAYVDHHFADEERMMEEADFPFLDMHRASHKAIEMRIDDLAQAISEDNLRAATTEICDFVHGWLVHHIEIEDAEYRPFLTGEAHS